VAETDFIAAAGFGAYTDGMIKRRGKLQHAQTLLNAQIEQKTEEVREAFQEMKKFQLAQDELEADEATSLQRLENLDLDEMAIDSHTRRKKAE